VVKTFVAVAVCVCSAFVALPADTEGENTNRASMQAFQIPSHGQLLNALVYVAVAITVASGLDYFFGLRRRIAQAQRSGA